MAKQIIKSTKLQSKKNLNFLYVFVLDKTTKQRIRHLHLTLNFRQLYFFPINNFWQDCLVIDLFIFQMYHNKLLITNDKKGDCCSVFYLMGRSFGSLVNIPREGSILAYLVVDM